QDDNVRLQSLRQRESGAFAGMEQSQFRIVYRRVRMNRQPDWRSFSPRANGGRRVRMPKFINDCLRRGDRMMKLRQNFFATNENEITKRRGVGDDDHLPWVSRRTARS